MLDKRYDFASLEARYAEAWERNGCFAPVMDGREPFAIMMPPPNVTGTLHMGHALDNTLPDILVRRARMQGKAAIYQPGKDHASIAVHVVLERQWAKEGKSRFDFGREKFLEKAWEWKDHSAGIISGQMRRLGISADWDNDRFTMDPAYCVAVNKVFVELYEKGLIYRGQRLVNWDPKMQTAVSDLEVKHKEVKGSLWHISYKFAGGFTYKGQDGIEIATTRPETLLADVAIAINPDDPRAKELVGKQVVVPVVGREIPIVADDMVDKDFGSGMVKITPAHDFNDFACWQRHVDLGLPLINLLTPDGKMNANCPEGYVGLDRFKARKKIVEDLEASGLLVKVEPHTHNVGHAERDDTVLEPYLTWQWYVKCDRLAKKCLAAADNGDVAFVNVRDEKVYRHWLENIQDWCISRQLWWGHRIPAWYREMPGNAELEIYVGEKAPAGEGWRQDEDILDTWFSSGLWPFVTQGWPNGGERLQAFYPGNTIMTGRDILFFWDIRMMMMSLELNGVVPFKTIYTHGLILDEHGQKMSKSKGNVLDPLDIMDQYGADALRLTMASIASAEDMRFSMAKVEQSRNFCTKLWNAARYLQMQGIIFDEEHAKAFDVAKVGHPINQWLMGELRSMYAKIDADLDAYAFNQAAHTLYHFTWGTFCDWYLELIKPLLAEGSPHAEETKAVLGWAFDKVLKALHPVIPFITEEIWSQLTASEHTFLMIQRWPDYAAWPDGAAVKADMDRLLGAVGAIRQARTQLNLPPKAKLKVGVRGGAIEDYLAHAPVYGALAGVEELAARESPAGVGEVTAVAGGVEFIWSLAGLVDVAAERVRLQREMEKHSAELAKLDALLGDEGFMSRAPAEKVAAHQARKLEIVDAMASVKGLLEGAYAQ